MYEVDDLTVISAKMDSLVDLVQKFAQVTLQGQAQKFSPFPTPILYCEVCGGRHHSTKYECGNSNSQPLVVVTEFSRPDGQRSQYYNNFNLA